MITPWLLLLPVPVIAALLAWRPLRSFSREVQAERAREAFKLQRERLEANFIQAAEATGKPRGLHWREIDWDDKVLFARERRTGQLAALVGATIKFEAVEGGDMEGLPAVGNLRNASAVFFHEQGRWLATGRTVFNLNPDEVIEHFAQQYERIEAA